VLVAKDEGLFDAEGLDLTLAPIPLPQTEAGTLTEPRTSQGFLVDRGEARMFQG
jgi:hypothetical protein